MAALQPPVMAARLKLARTLRLLWPFTLKFLLIFLGHRSPRRPTLQSDRLSFRITWEPMAGLGLQVELTWSSNHESGVKSEWQRIRIRLWRGAGRFLHVLKYVDMFLNEVEHGTMLLISIKFISCVEFRTGSNSSVYLNNNWWDINKFIPLKKKEIGKPLIKTNFKNCFIDLRFYRPNICNNLKWFSLTDL